jgi:hypothetical protein
MNEESFKIFINNLRSKPFINNPVRAANNHRWITKLEKLQNTIETVLVTIICLEVTYILYRLVEKYANT